MNDSPLDRALDLLLSDEPAAALRWSIAALERDPTAPHALFVTSCALARMGGGRAAIDGLRVAARRAAIAGDIPIAIAAIGDLRAHGADVLGVADDVAAVLCRDGAGAKGKPEGAVEGTLPFAAQTHVRPISPVVGGRALVSRATQMIYDAASAEGERPSPLGFFRALSREAARDLLLAFDTATVPAGHCLIEEGETTDCGFILACGAAEIWRRGASADERRVLAHLASGALFGELALLLRLPSPASVTTTRGSVVLVAWRDAIEAVGAKHPEVRFELGAHCKRQAAANLGSALGVLDAVPLHERAALIERMDLRTFSQGERLANLSEEADGLHVIVSGEVLLVARDGSEQVVLQTLAPGDTVGETELVLCRAANTEAVAVTDAATLFLPREEFFALSRDYPAILHGVYAVASRRHTETNGALDGRAAPVDEDECVVEEAPGERVKASSVAPSLEARAIESAAASEMGDGVSAAVPVDDAPPPAAVPDGPSPPPSPASSDSRSRSQGPPPLSARTAVGMTNPKSSPSLAPATTSQKPPPLPSTGQGRAALARRSLRATAIVAFAAGVCVVLAPRGDRRLAGVGAASGANPSPIVPESPGAEPAAPLPAPLASSAGSKPTASTAIALAVNAPSPSAAPSATAKRPTPPGRPHASSPAPSDVPVSPSPPAPASPPAVSAASLTQPTPRPSPAGESDFGGRE